MYENGLFLSAFIAGLITFLAPCTFPLLPGYIAFISGVPITDKETPSGMQKKVFINGLFFVLGFSLIFIVLGTLTATLAQLLGPTFRIWMTRVGGLIVIAFGFFMLDVIKVPFLQKNLKFNPPASLEVGKPTSSFIIGAAFGFGWTPCIGPVLGTILILATTTSTILQGMLLLIVFSLGLAVPFLIFALGVGSAYKYIRKISKYSPVVAKVGGVLMIIMGILLLTNNFGLLISHGYHLLNFLHYSSLQEYL